MVLTPDELESCQLHVRYVDSDATMTDVDAKKKPAASESRIVQFIDVGTRFLEGVFQNVAHGKDFVRLDGLVPLLRLFTLTSTPFDFSSSQSSFSLSYLFKVTIESSPQDVVPLLFKEFSTAYDKISAVLENENASLLYRYIQLGITPQIAGSEERVAEAQLVFRALLTLLALIRLFSDLFCTHSISHTKSVAAIGHMFGGAEGELLIKRLGYVLRVCVWERQLISRLIPPTWLPKKRDLFFSSISSWPAAATTTTTATTATATTTTATTATATDLIAVAETNVDSVLPAAGITTMTQVADQPMSTGSAPTEPLPDSDLSLHSGSVPITASDMPLDSTLPAAPSTVDTSTDVDHPGAKNARMIMHIVKEIPGLLVSILKAVLKFVCGRRGTELMVSCCCSSLLAEPFRLNYLAHCVLVIDQLVTDSRNITILQTIEWVAFEKAGGLTSLFDVYDTLVEGGLQLLAKASPTNLALKENAEIDAALQVTLDRVLTIFQHITHSKMLHDSPHTAQLVSRQKDKNAADYFDAHGHLVHMRISCRLRAKTRPVRVESSGNGLASSSGSGSARGLNALASLFGRPVAVQLVVADPDKVQQLCDMGFPLPAAESALVRCGNNIERAAEYLLMNPHVVASATFGASASRPAVSTSASAAAVEPASAAVEPASSGPSDSSSSEANPSAAAAAVQETSVPVSSATIETSDLPDASMAIQDAVDGMEEDDATLLAVALALSTGGGGSSVDAMDISGSM
ncbi:hypothetical protein BASA81_018289, partial [Batrachochytrium salamandrivorans]